MQGWHGERKRHQKAGRLGWLRRIGQRRAVRKRNKQAEHDIEEMRVIGNLKVVLNNIKNRLEVENVDKRRRIGVLVKPYIDRTVTHRIEMKWNPKTKEWEVVEVPWPTARKLGPKTLYFMEPEKE